MSSQWPSGRVNDKQLLAHVIVRWLEKLDTALQGTTFPSSETKRLRTVGRDNRCPRNNLTAVSTLRACQDA